VNHLPFLRGSLRVVLVGLILMGTTMANAGPFAYITNQVDATVSVIDTATNTVSATIPVGPSPLGVAVNAAGTRAYVANFGGQSVSVIDTSTNTVIDLIPLSPNDVQGIAVSADGSRVYAVGGENGHVSVIDTATDTVIAAIPVGRAPRSVAVNLEGTRVYVGNSTDNDHGGFTVIDATNNTVITAIPVAGDPWGIVVNASGTRVFVAHRASNSAEGGRVSVIDAQTNTVVATPVVPGGSYGLAMNRAGTRIYVTNTNFNSSVSVLDAHCAEVIANIPLPPVQGNSRYLFGISVAPDDLHVYVVTTAPNSNFNSVALIDATTNTFVSDIPVGNNPWAVGAFISPGVVMAPPPPAPIRVTGIELTQGIQDLANSVPLIYGKRAFARVHVKSDGADFPNVTASLSGLGAYMDGGGNVVRIPLGSLIPSNSGGPRIAVRADPKRSIVDDSFVFEIPWSWMGFESLRLGATLGEPAGSPPSGSCMSDLEEGPGANIEMPTHINVAFVRMGYEFPGVGPERTSIAEQLQTESWMRRTYPLSDLNSSPDFELFDASLGEWVERTAQACVLGFAAEDRNLCAHFYTTARLGALYATTTFFGFPDGHLIDDIDVVYGLIPQHFIGTSPEPYFTRGACCTNSVGAGPANDEDYASHEIGHFLGRQHPVEGAPECKHSASDPNYPYFFSFIAPPLSDPQTAMAGFDGGDAGISKPMRVLPASSSYDIMGYCQPTTWISDYTYHWLYICLLTLNEGGITAGCPSFGSGAPGAKPLKRVHQAGDWLLVYGLIAPDHASAALIDVERTDAIFSEPPRTPGDFSIQLIGDGGAMLADYAFTPEVGDDAVTAGGNGPPLSFGHAVPFVAGTREVRIVDTSAGGAVLASKAVSSNAPVVANVVAQAGSGTNIELTWTATDADGDALHFDVLVARNGGATLQPLTLGGSQTSADIDAVTLAGGDVTFRIIASDGLLTGRADSNPVALPNKPPQPRVLAPGSGTHVTHGQTVNLEGVAKDLQDGTLADTSLEWSSPQGVLGSGARLSVANLPLGSNRLTLTATNSLGLTGTSSVIVVVDADPIALGPTLTAGPGQLGWHVTAGELDLQTAELDIGNRGSGNLQFTVSSGAAWLTANVTQGTAPATITLTANPAGFAEGASVDTTVTVTAVGFPAQVITLPVRLAVGNTFVVGNAPPLPPDAIYRDGFDGG
jgi:YVTN family beta-propeller protein